MSLNFRSESEKQAFDACAEQWIKKYRVPNSGDFALIMQRAFDNSQGARPSVSAFERAYRELQMEGQVSVCNDKFVEPVTALKREELTAEAYQKIPAAEVARRYLRNEPGFRAAVDKLISEGKI